MRGSILPARAYAVLLDLRLPALLLTSGIAVALVPLNAPGNLAVSLVKDGMALGLLWTGMVIASGGVALGRGRTCLRWGARFLFVSMLLSAFSHSIHGLQRPRVGHFAGMLEVWIGAMAWLVPAVVLRGAGARRIGAWWMGVGLVLTAVALLVTLGAYLGRLLTGDARDATVRLQPGISILILLAPLVLMVCVMYAGLLVRRMTQRPPWVCDGCRYDLRGVSTGRCPECGADCLKNFGDTVGLEWVPVSVRSWWTATACLAIVALVQAAAFVVDPAWGNAGNRPFWLLLKEARFYYAASEVHLVRPIDQGMTFSFFGESGAMYPRWATDAQKELEQRFNASSLTPKQQRSLTATAVECLLDREAPNPNDSAWNRILGGAHTLGILDPEQVGRIRRDSWGLELVARPRVRQGDVVPFDVSMWWRGSGNNDGIRPISTLLGDALHVRLISLSLGNAALTPIPDGEFGVARSSFMTATYRGFEQLSVKGDPRMPHARVSPGTYELKAVFDVRWDADLTSTWMTPEEMDAEGVPREWRSTLQTLVEVVPQEGLDIDVTDDPDRFRKLVPSSVSMRTSWRSGEGFLFLHPAGGSYSTPAAAAFRVTLILDGLKHELSPAVIRDGPGPDFSHWMLEPELAARVKASRRAVLRLESMPSIAARTIDFDRVITGPTIELPISSGGR